MATNDPIVETTVNNNDKFETSLSVLGNELIRVNINSESQAKNWAFFGMISLVVVTILVANYGPTIVAMFQ